LPNIFKRFSQVKVEAYEFPDEQLLIVEQQSETDEPELSEELEQELMDEQSPVEELEPQPELPPQPEPENPIDYAQVQADAILKDAHRQAEQIVRQAESEAEERSRSILEAAHEQGYEEGYTKGAAQAAEENAKWREQQAGELGAEVQRFLEQASSSLDRQMDDQLEELRDIALTVAEKVVCISLKSSSEVICRMIQMAIDKRKHKEWVRIYISECDAKHLTEIPPALASALSTLSDRVRIIPVAEDEPGTCIIEMPDEIIDASASTQLHNIRRILTDNRTVTTAVNLG
jgi:flagellar assembly protein FliH